MAVVRVSPPGEGPVLTVTVSVVSAVVVVAQKMYCSELVVHESGALPYSCHCVPRVSVTSAVERCVPASVPSVMTRMSRWAPVVGAVVMATVNQAAVSVQGTHVVVTAAPSNSGVVNPCVGGRAGVATVLVDPDGPTGAAEAAARRAPD